MKYFVTALGCGIAGYKVSEIAPLFKGIHHNVIFLNRLNRMLKKMLFRSSQHSLKNGSKFH